MILKNFEKKIFRLQSEAEFSALAIKLFHFQAENNKIYKKYLKLLNIKTSHISSIYDIPCMPIDFFKNNEVKTGDFYTSLVFKSSGTTQVIRSKHHIFSPDLYVNSFVKTYKQHFGSPENQVILALLPSYLEAGDSSLVYMVDYLIQQTKNDLSGFYIDDYKKLANTINKCVTDNNKVILFGVSYALLDFSEYYYKNNRLSAPHNLIVIETGGMKGRKKEIIRTELHNILKRNLYVSNIYSEYGMTELLSQAYSVDNEWFMPSDTMRIIIRDLYDPFANVADNKSGLIKIIDLANIYSVAFIETQDIGVRQNKKFKVLGRVDNSDIRGCSLLTLQH